MNKEKRKKLVVLLNDLENVLSKLDNVGEVIDDVRADEEEAFENLSESLQQSTNGVKMSECIETLCNIVDYMEQAKSSVVDVIDGINDVVN